MMVYLETESLIVWGWWINKIFGKLYLKLYWNEDSHLRTHRRENLKSYLMKRLQT
jgi:hypothetical protein